MLTPENINAAAAELVKDCPSVINVGFFSTVFTNASGEITSTEISVHCHGIYGKGPTVDAAVADLRAKNLPPGAWRPVSTLPVQGQTVQVQWQPGNTAGGYQMRGVWHNASTFQPFATQPVEWREIQYPEVSK